MPTMPAILHHSYIISQLHTYISPISISYVDRNIGSFNLSKNFSDWLGLCGRSGRGPAGQSGGEGVVRSSDLARGRSRDHSLDSAM